MSLSFLMPNSSDLSSGAATEDTAISKGDKLILRGLKFHGFHGVKPEERKLGQKFVVDVDAWMDLHPAGLSDCLSDSISYTEIYRWVIDFHRLPSFIIWYHHHHLSRFYLPKLQKVCNFLVVNAIFYYPMANINFF